MFRVLQGYKNFGVIKIGETIGSFHDFVTAEESRNIGLGVERAEKQIDNWRNSRILF